MKAIKITIATIIIESLTSCNYQGSNNVEKVISIKRADNGKIVTRVVSTQNSVVGVGGEVIVEYSDSENKIIYGTVQSIEIK